MDFFNNINNILRSRPSESFKEYKTVDDNNNFIRVNKVILDNVNEQYVYKQLKEYTLKWINSYKNKEDEISFFIYYMKSKGEYVVGYKGENITNKLLAVYPDIKVEETQFKIEEISKFKFSKSITIIPKISDNEDIEISYDPFIKQIEHKNIIFKISTKSVFPKNIDDIYKALLEERTLISTEKQKDLSESECDNKTISYQKGTSENQTNGAHYLLGSNQNSKSENNSTTNTKGTVDTKTESRSYINYKVDVYDRILEQHINRIENMKLHGAWQTIIQIYSDTEENLRLAEEAINSTFSIKVLESIEFHDNYEPLNLISGIKKITNKKDKHILYRDLEEYINLHTNDELALLFQPNLSNIKGFSIIKRPRFLQNIDLKGNICLGTILNYTKDTGNKFKINDAILNKHILVAGMTGSGKTTTILSILNNNNLPFLIIEPAKSEYRILKSIMPNLRIYTLGRENVSPLRFNPFKFDYKKISVQEHIDNLKVIFTAAFTMYASMPNILEQCLINIYTKKGWSLINSTNILCKDQIIEEYFYPSLEELYLEIDSYIDSLGYAQEQNQNIRAALLTRIKSLMTGAKGFIFNTMNSIQFDKLLEYPTIIELEGIVDDVEKALIIGLLMINVYESVKSNNKSHKNPLKHIIVIEEAHRLLANFRVSENEEHVNMRSKAVETLSNMLCEVRAYGEGLIIVDQVPTKLAPDVLKNTNTKIIHRLVSKEDCEYIAQSIQINKKNIDFISTLKVGEALVYTELLDETAHIKIDFNKDDYPYYSDDKVKENAFDYNESLKEMTISNPIVESLISCNETRDKLIEEIKKYINDIYNIKLSLIDSYNKIKKICIKESYINGFEIKDNLDEYVAELIKKLVVIIISKRRFRNNIEQKYRFLNMIDTALKIGSNSKYIKNKEVKAFRIAIMQDIVQNL